MWKILPTAICVSLLGCASVPTDKSATAETASITFVNLTKAGRVQPYVYETAADCSNRRKLDSSPGGDEWAAEIPAGMDVSMVMYWDDLKAQPYVSCSFAWTFKPVPERKYVARLDIAGSKCFVDIKDASGTSVLASEVPTIRRRHSRVPWSGSGSWCQPE